MVVHVTIFRAGGKTHTVWMEDDTVHSTEVTLDVGQRLVIDYVVQLDLETSCSRASSGHILCILTTANEQVELLVLLGHVKWTDTAATAREVELDHSDLVERLRMEEFASAVSAASEHHHEIRAEFN